MQKIVAATVVVALLAETMKAVIRNLLKNVMILKDLIISTKTVNTIQNIPKIVDKLLMIGNLISGMQTIDAASVVED